ncbi:MAG: ribosome assembly cofactor RimP, partial [Bacteroidota bacterium]
LKLPRQFKKNQGRRLRIRQQNGEVVEGLLDSFDENVLSIIQKNKGKKKDTPPEPLLIPLNEVKEAKVLISFH